MTIILALKDKEDRLWIAGDSLASGEVDAFNVREPKVFQRGEFLYGYAGSFRLGQLVKYHFKEPVQKKEASDQEYIMKTWGNALQNLLFAQGFLREKDNVYDLAGSLIIGYRGHIYILMEDNSIIEPLDPFTAIGIGSTFAMGALAVLYDLVDPREAIQKAMDATCQFSPFCGGPVTIIKL